MIKRKAYGLLFAVLMSASMTLSGLAAETEEAAGPVQEETMQEETVQEEPAPEEEDSLPAEEESSSGQEAPGCREETAQEEEAAEEERTDPDAEQDAAEAVKEETSREEASEEDLSEDAAPEEELLEEETPEELEAEPSPFTEKDGKLFYYVNGKLQTGWKTVDGRQYYFKPGTPDKGMMLTGKRYINYKWYYLDPEKKTGFIPYGESFMYAGADGVLKTGWQTIEGKRYFFWSKTQKGHSMHEAAVGKRSVKKVFHLFDPVGGYLLYGLHEMDGRYYYTDGSGRLQKGFVTIGGARYYFNKTNNSYASHEGFLTQNGKKYICFSGKVQTGLIPFEGELYYGDTGGVLQTGWITTGGKKYYFLPQASDSQPVRAAVKGQMLLDETLYYFDDSGVLDESRTTKTGLFEKDGKWHFVYSTAEDGHEAGQMATGPVYYKDNYYQFDENGDSISGWQTIDGDYAWFDEKGMHVKNKAAMKITVIDYGNTNGSYGSNYGDPTLLESDGHYLLIDTALPPGGKKVIAKLKDMGVRRLTIYISHYHNDHLGAVPAILKDSYFTVDRIYLEDYSYLYGEGKDTYHFTKNTVTLEETIRTAEKKGVPITILNTGDTFECGLVKAEVLYRIDTNTPFTGNNKTNEEVSPYINNMSLCTRFTCGNVRFLHCGDIEKAAEKEILSKEIDLKADIFKLSHHGGNSSNTNAFLNEVKPAFAYYCNPGDVTRLCQDGWSAGIVQNAQSKGANVFHPLVNGHTTFSVTGGSIFVKTVRRSRTVDVKVINKITGKQETIKVTVQASVNGKYTIHENMIPFYYDLV